MSKNPLTVVELFAGVGGFRVGLERTGRFEVIWSNQWEPMTKTTQHASDVYVKNWKTKKVKLPDGREVDSHSNIDIEKVKTKDIPDCDVLVGGFPCQDYSVATSLKNSKGLEGKKGVLWWSIERIIREKKKKPKYLILENVDRLLKSPSNQRGRDFAIMLTYLNKLGYIVEWRVINAAEYGSAQRRRRVFIIGYHKSSSTYKNINKMKPSDWLEPDGTLSRAFPIKEISENDLNTFKLNHGLLSKKFDTIVEYISKNFGKDEKVSRFKNCGICIDNKVSTFKAIPNYLGESKTLGDCVDLKKRVNDSFYINEDKPVKPQDFEQLDGSIIKIRTEGDKWRYLKGRKNQLKTNSVSGYQYKYGEGKMIYPDPTDEPSRTIITGEGGPSPSRFKHVIDTPYGKRRLTPVELEKLNDFDADHTKLDGITDTKRAFFMGNALVCGIVEKIGKKLSL